MSGATDVERLQALMRQYGIAAFDYREGSTEVSLRTEIRTPDAARATVPDERFLAAPFFGTFHRQHPAMTGDGSVLPRRVKREEIVGYLAAAAVLRPVRAEEDCVLLRTLVRDGDEVGHGDRLFAVR